LWFDGFEDTICFFRRRADPVTPARWVSRCFGRFRLGSRVPSIRGRLVCALQQFTGRKDGFLAVFRDSIYLFAALVDYYIRSRVCRSAIRDSSSGSSLICHGKPGILLDN
jgi:hypothetical protein